MIQSKSSNHHTQRLSARKSAQVTVLKVNCVQVTVLCYCAQVTVLITCSGNCAQEEEEEDEDEDEDEESSDCHRSPPAPVSDIARLICPSPRPRLQSKASLFTVFTHSENMNDITTFSCDETMRPHGHMTLIHHQTLDRHVLRNNAASFVSVVFNHYIK
ncbi:hypothetical protein JOB18_002408 [Solea senegalensis]|uniref:Uncharacterized protein n=1 Tax=Solea senegalensis TaxID=28829 RepID=A0AAV6RAD9_SOLSE|nr:hypothetical protein JOB18_002408 [Solea senegalensis]